METLNTKTRKERIVLERSGDAQVIFIDVPVVPEENKKEAMSKGLVVNGPPSDANEGVR